MPIHAFMRRTWFVCATCAWYDREARKCERNGPVRWNPNEFGCGDYCITAEDFPERQMTLEAYR